MRWIKGLRIAIILHIQNPVIIFLLIVFVRSIFFLILKILDIRIQFFPLLFVFFGILIYLWLVMLEGIVIEPHLQVKSVIFYKFLISRKTDFLYFMYEIVVFPSVLRFVVVFTHTFCSTVFFRIKVFYLLSYFIYSVHKTSDNRLLFLLLIFTIIKSFLFPFSWLREFYYHRGELFRLPPLI